MSPPATTGWTFVTAVRRGLGADLADVSRADARPRAAVAIHGRKDLVESGAGPLVDGVECVRGHFNRPGTRYCVICGIGLRQGSRPARGRRPPLGVLVAPNGSAPVGGDVIIGAAPETHPDVAAGRAVALRVDPGIGIADAHARVTARDWTVEVHAFNPRRRVLDPASGAWSDVALRPCTPWSPAARSRSA